MFELYSNVRIYIPVLKECVFLVHALEKWRLQMMLARKYHSELVITYKENFVFYWERGRDACDERNVTQEGSRE